MPRSAPGNNPVRAAAAHVSGRRPASPPHGAPHRGRALRGVRARGFTLIELMVVVMLVAVAAGLVSLSLRDSRSTRLEREGERLATLLETARAEARAASLPVRWMPTPDSNERAFRFAGLPASRKLPEQWLDAAVVAQVVGGRGSIELGPEALIGVQRVQLVLDDERIEVATDGLQPFAVRTLTAAATP